MHLTDRIYELASQCQLSEIYLKQLDMSALKRIWFKTLDINIFTIMGQIIYFKGIPVESHLHMIQSTNLMM